MPGPGGAVYVDVREDRDPRDGTHTVLHRPIEIGAGAAVGMGSSSRSSARRVEDASVRDRRVREVTSALAPAAP